MIKTRKWTIETREVLEYFYKNLYIMISASVVQLIISYVYPIS
nr:hypothetical protein [Mycoplasmopsis bovis]